MVMVDLIVFMGCGVIMLVSFLELLDGVWLLFLGIMNFFKNFYSIVLYLDVGNGGWNVKIVNWVWIFNGLICGLIVWGN